MDALTRSISNMTCHCIKIAKEQLKFCATAGFNVIQSLHVVGSINFEIPVAKYDFKVVRDCW
jgi:hypothetical protein